jgi:hypothetical protein
MPWHVASSRGRASSQNGRWIIAQAGWPVGRVWSTGSFAAGRAAVLAPRVAQCLMFGVRRGWVVGRPGNGAGGGLPSWVMVT